MDQATGGLAPRLLIVDDVAENREVLRRRFERRGFRCEEAEGGEAALAAVASQAFDCILLDINMPDLNGIEVLRRIRKTHPAVELPVIMVTAQTQAADVQAAVEAEANAYVAKPVEFDIALARVETALKKRAEHLSRDPATPVFHTFPETAQAIEPHPVMGIAAEPLVLQHLTVEQIAEKLGGCARYLDDRGGAYLGVWGPKNVERLHALLSARVPKLIVKRERPPWSRLEWRKGAAGAAA
ncbi:MAG TPA: response regulator [Caulobacteraceae bacterium]